MTLGTARLTLNKISAAIRKPETVGFPLALSPEPPGKAGEGNMKAKVWKRLGKGCEG